MIGADHRHRLVAARCALGLFISGVVLPLVMALLGYRWDWGSRVIVPPPIMLSLIAEFVALALGFVGRRHLSGKVGMIGALVILACAFLFPAFN